jgi:predicted permease
MLRSRLQSLFLRRRREGDLREELQLHIDREAERLRASGVPHETARIQAQRAFGGIEPIKDACRDARGIALLENVARDVRYTWRSFRRTPLVALTIVTTVGLGLGLVAVVFTILNAYIFRQDQVRNPDELFAVERQRSANAEPDGFTRPQYEALVRDTGIFADAFATTGDVDAWIEGTKREGALVTGNFFQVLGAGAARGRTLTPADDQPGGAPALVLSHRAWSQHYDRDPGILDRTVRVNGAPFHIVGVMPEGFHGLLPVAAPDFWAPLSELDRIHPGVERSQESPDLQIVGRLKPGVPRGQALAQLLAWDSRQADGRPEDRPATSLVLSPRQGTVPLSAEIMLLFMPLFFAFGLILMIGCGNVANLLLARAVARQREIGIRLAIGASRRRVVSQLLTESLLLALVAAALAFGISRLVLSGVVYTVTSTFPSDIGDLRLAVPPADWRVALFLVAGAVVSTLLFALAPALQATRVELVRAVRGEVVRDARPARARNALVALQVTGSVLLLICAAIFLRSTWAAAAVDPGIRTANIVTMSVLDEPKRGTVLAVVEREPSTAAVAAAWPGWLGGVPALAEGATGKTAVTWQFVSPEYFGVLGIDLVRGRGFTETERSASAAVAIVSESTARQLWPGADAVGQILRIEPDPARDTQRPDDPMVVARSAVVVGIAGDVAGFRLAGVRLGGAGVYMPTNAGAPGASLTIAVRGNAERARQALVDRLAAIDPNMGEVSTLQTMAHAEAYLLGIPFWLTLVLGLLALLLTLSGLFSVLSYLVEQRTREIGVRLAIGATSRQIGALVLTQSARPVVIGLVLGTALTAGLGAALLATPAAEQIGSTVGLFDPVAYAASLLGIATACTAAALIPALRAGRIDPVLALRQD